MHAETIAVGTEITSGAKLDTNSQWLSRQLAELGIATRYHTGVADDLAANVEVFRLAVQRADVVIVTGGLGPTLDDLTRHALAEMLGVGLYEDAPSLAAIEALFTRRGRPMPDSNRIQAMFPLGSRALPNPIGTAPGLWCDVPRSGREPCRFIALPGVPSEMLRMYKEQVEPRLTGDTCIRRAVVNCFGLGESQTEELLGDLTRRGADPEIGITAHEATISLRVIACGIDPAACQRKLDAATAAIESRLGHFVFSRDDEEPEHVVVRLLRERRGTLAVCEFATGGNLSSRLTAVPGSDEVCRAGLVLTRLADVPLLINAADQNTMLETSAAGELLARQLAAATRDRLRTDYALAVTPWGNLPVDGPLATVPTAWVALADNEGTWSAEARQTGNPAIFAPRTAKVALDLLRRRLLQLPMTI